MSQLVSAGPNHVPGTEKLTLGETPLLHALAGMAGIMLLYLGVHFVDHPGLREHANWILPVALILLCLWTCYRHLRVRPLAMWTPPPWFLLACAVYLGFGPLSYTFASAATVSKMDTLYPVGAAELWRVNLLNSLGIVCVLAAFLGGSALLRKLGRTATPREPSLRSIKLTAVLFLAVGLPIQYFLRIPFKLETLGFVLPSMFQQLTFLVKVGLLILAYLATVVGGRWRIACIALLLIDMSTGMFMLEKEKVLLSMMMVGLGGYLAKPKLIRFGVVLAACAVVFVLLQPVILWGRLQVLRGAKDGDVTLIDRAKIAGQAVQRIRPPVDVEPIQTEKERAEPTVEAEQQPVVSEQADAPENAAEPERVPEKPQSWWFRLSYVAHQAFAMNQYDLGKPGKSIALGRYVFIPRVFWPGKPIINPGTDFTEMYRGHRLGANAIGIFAEAYWNGGWLAVPVMAAFIGLLFAGLTRMSLFWITSKSFLFLPCVFLAVRMGFRIDGWFAHDYAAAPMNYLAMMFALWCISAVLSFLARFRKPESGFRRS